MSAESPDNEYRVLIKDGQIQSVEYVSDKGGDEVDYITEINVDKPAVSSDYATQYSLAVEVEYTPGPGNNSEKAQKEKPTPGYREIHRKTHTDLAAYEFLVGIFTGGQTKMTTTVILRSAAQKTLQGFTKHAIQRAIERGFTTDNVLKIIKEGTPTQAIGRFGSQTRYTLGKNTVVVNSQGKVVTVYSTASGTAKGLGKGDFIPFD